MGKYVVVDVESDGPIQGYHSMVCFGAVIIDREGKLDQTFYAKTAPIGPTYDPEALSISGFSREQHENFDHPHVAMVEFDKWLKENTTSNPILISDNNGYDAAWINWYFHSFVGKNPFGWSSRRIGDMFSGFMNNPRYDWKKHRKTRHSHDPVDDAKGNAEAVLWLFNKGFNLDL